MRDLMKRLERLEQARADSDDLPTLFIRFVGMPGDDPGPSTISCDGESLARADGESWEGFKLRAAAHFEPKRNPGCGLLMFINGEGSCAI